MKCDIIIPVWNNTGLTRDCLESVYANTRSPFNMILIDNASAAQTRMFLEDFTSSHANARLVRNPDNLGWVKAVNQGITLSESPYICVMNNDTIVKTDDWLAKLIEVAETEPDIGLVNPYFEPKKISIVKGAFTEVDFCRGYCVLIKRSVMEKVGSWDETYGMGYYDDHDYSIRAIRAGFRCVRANSVFVKHLGDSTFSVLFTDARRKQIFEENRRYFRSKWGRQLNIVFIVTKKTGKAALESVLFSLARRQHIIYLWNMAQIVVAAPHINIRQKLFPPLFYGPILSISLRLNRMKKGPKRYDLIFTDDEKLLSISRWKNVYAIDVKKDAAGINNIVDSASRA